MPWELIYTSAPRGLQAGQSGLCTVAQTAEIPGPLARKLEQISYYDHLSTTRSARFTTNPKVAAHRILDLAGQRFHVLSRLSDAGLDFTRRTNFLARHWAFTCDEIANLPSPAQLLRHWAGWRLPWTGNPRLLPTESVDAFILPAPRPLLPAAEWKRLTGDERRAAGLLVPPCSQGCLLEIPEGQEESLLDLLAETLHVVTLARRSPLAAWQHPFTTFFQAEDSVADFTWRGAWPSSPGWEKESTRGGLIRTLDSVPVPNHEFAAIAREGRIPPPPSAPALPARPTQSSTLPTVASGPMPRPSSGRLVPSQRDTSQQSTPNVAVESPSAMDPHGNRRRRALVLAGSTAVILLAILFVWTQLAKRPRPVPVQLGTLGNTSSPARDPKPLPGSTPGSSSTNLAVSPRPALNPRPVILLQIADDLVGAVANIQEQFRGAGDASVRHLADLIEQIQDGEYPVGSVVCQLVTSNAISLHPQPETRPGERAPQGAALGFGLGGIRKWGHRDGGITLEYVPDPGAPWTNGFAALTLHWRRPDAALTNAIALWMVKPRPASPHPMKLEIPGNLRTPVDESGPNASFGGEIADFLSRTVLASGWTWALDLYSADNPSTRSVYSRWTPEIGLPPPRFGDELLLKRQLTRLTNELTRCSDQLSKTEEQRGQLTHLFDQTAKLDLPIGDWFGAPETHPLRSFLTYWSSLTDGHLPEVALQDYLRHLLDFDTSNVSKLAKADKDLLKQKLRIRWRPNSALPPVLGEFQASLTRAGYSPGEQQSVTNALAMIRRTSAEIYFQHRQAAGRASELDSEIQRLRQKRHGLEDALSDFPSRGLASVSHAVLRIVRTARVPSTPEGIEFIRFERTNSPQETAP